MSHQHEWAIASVVSQTRTVRHPAAVSADDDQVIVQAKILYRCTVTGCAATKVERYEGPPEGLPSEPVPEEIRLLHGDTMPP